MKKTTYTVERPRLTPHTGKVRAAWSVRAKRGSKLSGKTPAGLTDVGPNKKILGGRRKFSDVQARNLGYDDLDEQQRGHNLEINLAAIENRRRRT